MSETKLLPCPFCGMFAMLEDGDDYYVGDDYYAVYCSNPLCDIAPDSGIKFTSEEAAATAWNERPAPALTPEQAAAGDMREALEVCEHVLSDLPAVNVPESRVRNAWQRTRAALAKAGKP